MGGTHYCVLGQGGGRIFVTSHLTTGARTLASRGGAPPVQVSMQIIGALLIVNRALNSLEIKRRSNPQNYCVLFTPSTSGD